MRNMKSSRKIQNLKSARKLQEPPVRFQKKRRLKGSKAKGLTYERTVGRRLAKRIEKEQLPAELVSGQWFAFEDSNGYGCCQIDHYLICPGFIIILECKLTQTDSAEPQLRELYEPIIREVYKCPVMVIQVCKNLRHHPAHTLLDIREAIYKPRPEMWTWHFTP